MYFLKKVLEKIFLKINGAEFVFEDYYENQYFELKKKKITIIKMPDMSNMFLEAMRVLFQVFAINGLDSILITNL